MHRHPREITAARRAGVGRWRHAAAAAAALLGCGGDADEQGKAAPPTRFGLEVVPDEENVVAVVDGVPVFASCVAAQMVETAASRDRALEDCIAFELLAGEAAAQGYLAHPDVQAAGKREAVRLLVERDLGIRGPEDLPADMVERVWERTAKAAMNRPEIRTSFNCRAELAKTVADDAPEAKAARAKLAKLVASVPQTIDHETFVRACRDATGADISEAFGLRHTEGRMLQLVAPDLETRRAAPRDQAFVHAAYADAAYSVKREGGVAVTARTSWGYDAVWVPIIEPAREVSFEEAEPMIREQLLVEPTFRNLLFERWSKPFFEGIEIEVHPDSLPEPDPFPVEGG